MRCKNCGWPNKPTEQVCVKCHTPLTSDEGMGMSGNGYVQGYDVQGNNDSNLGKTVQENYVFGVRQTNSGTQPENYAGENTSSVQCPKCGYPLRQGVDKCPNCKFSLSNSRQPEADASSRQQGDYVGNTKRRPTRMDNGSSAPLHGGTVNPYMMNIELEPSFVLKPLKRMNERHELDELEYEGKEVVLNRDNTEANNSSITSREQAVVTKVDGRWYIEDKSEQKTTFVQAAQRIELHDGDIILLGNRLFEFHE